MKYVLLSLMLFLSITVSAQNRVESKITTLDRNITVKNESGEILNYDTWFPMVRSGSYSLRRILKNGVLDSAHTIYRLSEEQIKANKVLRDSILFKMPNPRISDALKKGTLFKGDKFTSISGVKFDSRKNTDKIYVINFWFINCPPCKQEIPDLNKIVEKFKANKDVIFIAVALDSSFELKQFLKTTGFAYNIVPDGRYYAEKYGVKAYPTHVIIGKDNEIKFSSVGLAPNTTSWIEKTIDEQLKQN